MAVTFSITRTTTRFHDSNGNGIKDPGETDFDTVDVGVYDPGETLYTRISFTNTGNQTATNVSIGDNFTGSTLVSGSLNISPIAFNDSFTAVGNTTLRVGQAGQTALTGGPSGPSTTFNGNVLTNDVGSLAGDDRPGFTITTGTFASLQGGTVTMYADGSFTYINQAGDTGVDSFQYTIRDAGFDNISGNGDDLLSIGTVTITLTGEVWYVDSAAAPGGTGTSANPFNNMDALNGVTGDGTTGDDVDGVGDTIYVQGTAQGNGTGGGIVLENNQLLIGRGADLVVSGFTVATAGSNSTIGSTTTNGYAVTAGANNTIAGLNIVGSGDNTGGITDNQAGSFGTLSLNPAALNPATPGYQSTINATGAAINLSDGAIAGNGLSNVTSSGGANNISLTNLTGTLALGGGSMTNATGSSFLVSGGTLSTSYTGGITQANNAALLDVQGHSGTLTFSSGTLSATNGTGLQFSNADGTYNLNGTNTLNGGDAGIDILNGAAGTFTFSSNSSITNPTGDALVIDSSGATVTFGGSITDNSGRVVSINEHDSANNITFTTTSSITATAGSSGILIQNSNTGGTIAFNGQVELTTTTQNAVTLTGNTSKTINFNSDNNGLDIVTTTGGGFVASGGGTINIGDLGTGNTINSAGGVAFSATGTTIGASGVTFDSISANGGTNGIVLNGTGSTGAFTVLGSGTTVGSGGTITNTTSDGILLVNAAGISLNGMVISHTGQHGVSGTGVTNVGNSGTVNNSFRFTNGLMDSPGNGDNESAFWFDTLSATNITGRMTISNTTIQNFEDVGIHVGNQSGTLIIDVTNVVIDNNSDTNGEEGIDVDASGTANTTLNVTGTPTGLVTSAAFTSTTRFLNLEGGAINGTVHGNGVLDVNLNGVLITGVGGPDLFPTPPALTFSAEGSASTFRFDIAGNRIADFKGDGIFIGHEGTIEGRIQNNAIVNVAAGDGIRIDTDTTSASAATILIKNNTISNVGDDGIQVLHRDGTKPMNLTIESNTFNTIVSEAIRVFVDDDVSGGGPDLNLSIINNTFGANIASNGFDYAIFVQSQDPGTEVNTHISGNTGLTTAANRGIALSQGTSGVLTNSAASAAALSGANGGVQVDVFGTVTFNVPVTVTQPSNPIEAAAPPPEDQPQQQVIDTPEADNGNSGTTAPPAAGNGSTPPAPAPTGPVVVDDGVLSQAELNLIVDAAIARWAAAGASDAQIAAMRAVAVSVADLGGLTLGESNVGTIVLDSDAAGWRWFVDSTPGDDSEYSGSGTQLAAVDKLGTAGTRIDLLTVLTHELGHQIGLSDTYVAGDKDELMYGTIGAGERRLPGSDDLAGAAGAPVTGAFAFAPITLGTIPAGQTVIVEFRHTIDAPGEDRLVGAWSGQTTVDSTETDPQFSTVESGLVDGLTLGDLVFKDVNKNGLYDSATDTLLAGVSLTLFGDSNNNGVYDDGVDLYVGYNEVNGVAGYQQGVDTPAAPGTGTALTATTAANGTYSFGSLAPGDYIVRVNASNFNSGQPLNGLQVAPGTAADPDDNANNDNNAVAAGGFVASRAITLSYDNEGPNFTPGAGVLGNDTNNTLDLGFFAPNAAPVFGALNGDTRTYIENGAAVAVDLGQNATVTDGDSANFDGGSLTLAVNGSNGDRITWGPGTSFDGDNKVFVGATHIGTLSTSGHQIIVTFNSNANAANIQTLVRSFLFDVSTDTPTAGTRTFTFTLVDGDGNDGGLGNDTGTASATIEVVAVSDAPQGADRAGTGLYDSTGAPYAFTVADFATGFSDPNDSPANSFSAVKITTLPAGSAGTIYFDSNLADATPAAAISAGDTFTAQDLADGKLTFVGAPNSAGTAMSFTFQVIDNGTAANGGVVMDPNPDTFSTTIVAGNSAPALDLDSDGSGTGFSSSYTEGGAAAAIGDTDVSITDSDATDDIVSATITITNPEAGDKLNVGTLPASVTLDATSTDTVVKLTAAPGTSRADFDAAIKAITFSNTGDDPTDKGSNLSRSISVVVNDGTADSNVATATVSVTDVNDAPTGTSSTITAVEDTHRTLGAGDFGIVDADGTLGSVTISAVTGGGIYYDADGSGNVSTPELSTLPATFSKDDLNDGKVSFRADPNANGSGTGTITFTVADDDGAEAAGSNVLTVDVTAVNDAPVLTTDSPVSATEQTAVAILPAGSVSDVELDALNNGNGNYAGAQFSVNRNTAASTDDIFTLVPGLNFTVDGTNLKTTGGQIFATISANNPGLLVINFNSSQAIATSALVDEVIQSVRYTNISNDPPASVDLAVGLTDGSTGGGQGTVIQGQTLDVNVVTVNIAGVNDAPVNSLGATIGVNEDGVDAWLSGMSISDPDADPATDGILVTFKVANGSLEIRTDVENGIVAGDIKNQDVGTITVLATLNQINATLAAANGLTYTPNANFNGDDALTVTTNDRGFDGTDPGLTGDHISEQDEDSRTITVSAADDAAIAQNDAVSTTENAIGTGSLFADNDSGPDSDPDGDPFFVTEIAVGAQTYAPGTVIDLPSGAKLTVNSDGTYSYDPNGKFKTLTDNSSGAVNKSQDGDTFSYTVTGGDTATVTVKVTGVAGPGDLLMGDGTDNTITGTPGPDQFRLQQGGDDTAFGLGGNDIFYFGAAFDGDDRVDGGEGADGVTLQGNYTLTLSATNLTSVEALSLQSGAVTKWGDTANNFYNYNIKTHNANVAMGQQLIVNGQSLRVGENFTFDGSAETDGSFLVFGGRGVDTLTGGAGNDFFIFDGDRWGAGDSVNGGAGRDGVTITAGNGLTHIEFGATSLIGIEALSVNNRYSSNPAATPSYEFVLHDGNVAAGGSLIVNGISLVNPTQTFSVDGTAVTAGKSLILLGGAGIDVLRGGAGNDIITGGLNSDTMTGGGGNDVFKYDTAQDSSPAGRDGIGDFNLGDILDLSGVDADSTLAGNQAFTFIGSGAFTGQAGQLQAVHSGGGLWIVSGDTDGVGGADFQFSVTVIDHPVHPLTQADFIL